MNDVWEGIPAVERPAWRAAARDVLARDDRGDESLRLQTTSGVPDRLAWMLVTQCDVIRLHRIAASTTAFTLPELVPEWARHFWEAQ